MNKRQFLQTAAISATTLPFAASQAAPANLNKGPGLLTVTGLIGKANRGPLDPLLDQMMVKQKVTFDKAFVFDFAAISALPAVTIKPTLEYDAKVHSLRGPLLVDVLKAAGAPQTDATRLFLRALDGYVVAPTLGDVRKYRFILATHLDGVPLVLGGLGPFFVVYDADRFADMAAKPVTERFPLCPWGCYHIDVKSA